MKTRIRFQHLLLLALFASGSLSALADETWTGSFNNQWGVGANWSTTSPNSSDAVIFNNLSLLNLSNVLGGQDFTIKEIILSNAPGPVTIAGANTLTLMPVAVGTSLPVGVNLSNAVQSLTISAPVSLGNTQSWAVASGQAIDVPGAISGVGGLYKDNLGTLTLEGTNSFTGNFTNNGGPVWINNSAGLGTGAKSIYIANNLVGAGLHLNGTNGNITLPGTFTFTVSQNLGAIFNEAGDNAINGGMYVYSGGGLAYIVANAGSLTLNGTIGLSTTARPFQVGGAANGIINGPVTAGLPLTKSDSGTWTLNNPNNTYNGATLVEGGTLVLNTNATIPNTPSITLLNNATLDASVVSNANSGVTAFRLNASGGIPQTLAGNGVVKGNVLANGTASLVPGGINAIGTLSFSNNLSLANMTSSFEFNTATNPGAGLNDLVNVAGDLDPGSFGGAATIFVTALGPLTSPGTYRLFNYSGAKPNSFGNVTLQTDTRYTLSLDDTSITNQVNLTVNGPAGYLTWNGANGSSWNLSFSGSPSWTLNGGNDYFYNGDAVTFDDSAGANTFVSIDGTVRPGSVTISNNSTSYSFSGSGKITGPTGLTKNGTGGFTNTLATWDFTGPVTVNQGVLNASTLANMGSASTLGAGSTLVLNGGTVQFTGAANRTWNRFVSLGAAGGTVDSSSTGGYLFLTNTISGSGSLTKIGAKQLIIGDSSGAVGGVSIAGSNTYTGNTYLNVGEIQVRNAHGLGSGKVVVATGCDLAFGGAGVYGICANNIDLNGDGPSSAGALEANDAGTQVTYGGTINLVTSSTVGVFANASAFTISGPIIGPGALKKGVHAVATIILTCPTNSYSGGTSNAGGILQLGNGGTCGGLGSGAVTNYGTLAYNHSDNFTNNSAISGTGALTHTGTGSLTLGGASTYSGSTTVNAGTLVVNGSLTGSAVGVANGGTLGGYGLINGPVTVNTGGILALGNSIGTLTVSNNLNLAGTNIMKVSHTGSAANDSINGISVLSMGGALNVAVSGSLQGGDTFKLFNATTYAGAFSSTNLPSLGANMTWDTSGLTNGTLRVVSTVVPPPTVDQFLRLGDGNFQLKFSGQSGSSYHVWATTNLAFKPITSAWSNLSSGTFNGLPVAYPDLKATNYPRRFYLITIP